MMFQQHEGCCDWIQVLKQRLASFRNATYFQGREQMQIIVVSAVNDFSTT